MRALCARHSSAAIHTRGKSLQLYRIFESTSAVAKSLRRGTESLQGWEKSVHWKREKEALQKMEHEVIERMERHKELHAILTRGVAFEGRSILIHTYKFEPDPMLKVELIASPDPSPEELPLQTIASLLRCHEFLVPESVAMAKPPYTRHEAQFLTIPEYLSQTMPRGLYATQCFPPPRRDFG